MTVCWKREEKGVSAVQHVMWENNNKTKSIIWQHSLHINLLLLVMYVSQFHNWWIIQYEQYICLLYPLTCGRWFVQLHTSHDALRLAAAAWPLSGPLALFLTHHSSVCYRMWQPHATKLRWVRAHRPWLSGLGTEHQRESSMWFVRCHTSLTLGIFWGMNNSLAGNPAFLLPLPVCDERPYHGQTLIDHDKMNHCSSRPEKKFRG